MSKIISHGLYTTLKMSNIIPHGLYYSCSSANDFLFFFKVNEHDVWVVVVRSISPPKLKWQHKVRNMPKKRLPAIANRAAWEKVKKGRELEYGGIA